MSLRAIAEGLNARGITTARVSVLGLRHRCCDFGTALGGGSLALALGDCAAMERETRSKTQADGIGAMGPPTIRPGDAAPFDDQRLTHLSGVTSMTVARYA